MKRNKHIIMLLLLIFGVLSSQDSNAHRSVTDIDGNVYQTVVIGDQLWMAENLKVTRYNNDEEIEYEVGGDDWDDLTTGAYSVYDNEPSNANIYGNLYNWYVVDDSRDICPEGWHVPSDEEWYLMTNYLAPETQNETSNNAAGGLMKSTGTIEGEDGLWLAPNTGATNESGFSAVPSGYVCQECGGNFYRQLGLNSFIWSSTEINEFYAGRNILAFNSTQYVQSNVKKTVGYPIRCLADEIIQGCIYPSACNYDETANVDDGSCEYEVDECGVCGGPGIPDNYTQFDEFPETATILDGNSCLSNVDLDALSDLIEENGLVNDSIALEVGNQTWNGGRLKILTASYSPSGTDGVNTQLTTLPESFGNLSALTTLYLEWNSLTNLPQSFSQLTNLSSLTINNNWLTELPSDIGNLENLFFLDLGYNQLNAIPASLCTMVSLVYLYLFNNELTALPDCICNLSIDWSGQDGGWSPYFASGGNYLCENVPDCISSSSYFESTLDQFYYSVIQDAPQGCCIDEAACNYNENATVSNYCEYPGDEGTEYEDECDCDGNVEDCDGECDGALIGTGVFECIDESYSNQGDCVSSGNLWEQIGNDCSGECGGSAVEDCAGVCGGDADMDDCGECGGDNSGCDVTLSFGEIDGNAGTVEIYMQNNVDVAGFQISITDEPDDLELFTLYGGSSEEYGFTYSFQNFTGEVIFLGFSFSGAIIPPGEEILVVLEFINMNADNQAVELCFSEVILAGPAGNELSVLVGEEDCVTMSPYEECSGDINEDGVLNVIDIVVLVNIILGASDLSPCADINEDGTVNVLDLVALVNYILYPD